MKNTESPAQGKRKKDDIRIYPEPTRIAKARETALRNGVPAGAIKARVGELCELLRRIVAAG